MPAVVDRWMHELMKAYIKTTEQKDGLRVNVSVLFHSPFIGVMHAYTSPFIAVMHVYACSIHRSTLIERKESSNPANVMPITLNPNPTPVGSL